MSNQLYSTPVIMLTEQAAIWAVQRRASTPKWIVEAYARCHGGIMYIDHVYPGETFPTTELILDETLRHGVFSPRPCRLDGDYFDPSMSHCILFLLVKFCRYRKISISELFDRALADTPRIMILSLAPSILQGMWEGVVVPSEWSQTTIDALLYALTDVGWGDLADLLEQKLSPQE